jgi:hypothetical protein
MLVVMRRNNLAQFDFSAVANAIVSRRFIAVLGRLSRIDP